MHRNVTTFINWETFALFSIIMLLFNCSLNVYGQESRWSDINPLIKRNLPEKKSMVVDSVKYTHYQNHAPFAESSSTFQTKKGAYPSFYTDKSPLHKGEYNVSGVIRPLWNGHVYGRGRQINLIGIGIFNYAAIGYKKSLSDNLFAEFTLHAMKLSMPHRIDEMFGISGMLSYSFNPRISLNVFGGFLFNPATSFSRNDYGCSVAFDITNSFGTELGIRGYREYPYNYYEVTPIVMPYFKSKKYKVKMDFGGLVQDVIYGLFK